MSGSFPDTRHKMLRAGYTLVYSRPCAKCTALTDRWRTRNGKEITMDAGEEYAVVQPHAATCTIAKKEREQRELYKQPVAQFARANQAQVVILVDRLGERHFSVNCLADPADLHIILTCAADAVRDFLVDHQSREQL